MGNLIHEPAFDTDLLIIGAGIHGAALAREASARGWKVTVLEQYAESALGTSSKSSKLIHGGLRYLENLEIGLVRECLREQRLLLNTAPHLVRSNRFIIPVTQQMKRPAWMIQLGLWLYYALGSKRPTTEPAQAMQIDGLKTDAIQRCLVYHDAQTDDKPLTDAILHSANTMGAQIHYSTKPESIVVTENGVQVSTNQAQVIRARAIANLSGPWVNDILAQVQPAQARAEIDLVQGSHIVLPDAPIQGCYYLEAEDQRVVFVMPWRGQRLVGTTEVNCDPQTRQPVASEQEIEYLLRTHNHYFKQNFSRAQVVDAWAGLRVLPKGVGQAFKRPRESIYQKNTRHRPRLISLIGGKLTSHRATAEQLCDLFSPVMPAPVYKANTRTQGLPIIQHK